MADHINMKTLIKRPKFGCSCMFVAITSDIGIKFYSSKSERNYAFKLQKKASKFRIGPNVFGKIDLDKPVSGAGVTISDYGFQYGYLTQKARTSSRITDSKIEKLIEKMNDLGFHTSDVCAPNVGYIGKRLVCIDFDEGSMGSY